MGKAARVRSTRTSRLSLTFCDLDFERASRPFGRGVAPAPPEGWAVARAGLVHARWNGNELNVTGDELIDGPHVASRLVSALAGRQLVVGHGLLSCDLRAVAMVTAVPDTLARRCVDTLNLAHRHRGGRFSTGCNLSDLAWENLQLRRSKPHMPDRFGPAQRGAFDPRDDADLVGKLWQFMMTAPELAWGSGLTGGKKGSAPLTRGHRAELTASGSHPAAESFRSWLRYSPWTAARLPSPELIRHLADRLHDADLLPVQHLSDEELLTSCQWMGIGQNTDVRRRIAEHKPLTKDLRYRLAQAIWESQNLEFMREVMQTRRQARESWRAASLSQVHMERQAVIREKIYRAVAPHRS